MKKIFSLFAAMLVAFAVNAQEIPSTDFAGGYFFAADDAVLDGDIELYTASEPHYLRYNDHSPNGTATWQITVTKASKVTVTLNMTNNVAGPKNGGHIFEVKVLDGEKEIGSLAESAESEVYTDIALAGEIKIPAGTYTIELLNSRAWSKCGIKGITLEAEVLPEVDFEDGFVCTPANAKLIGRVSVDGEILKWGNNSDASLNGVATWKVYATRACAVSAVINNNAENTSGHCFSVAILDEDGNQVGDALAQAANSWSHKDEVLSGSIKIPAAGEYTIQLSNSTAWSGTLLDGITIGAQTIYLKPTDIWATGGAQFGIYAFADAQPEYFSEIMALAANETEIYSAVIPAVYDKLVFMRLNDGADHVAWDQSWNQSVDLTIDNDLFTITGWSDGKGVGEWSKYVAPEPVIPGKFYITGDAALVGEALEWNPAAIKVMEDSYTFENLAAGSYMLKVTEKGDWSIVKGFDALTTVEPGVTRGEGGDDDNICFTLAEAGNVTVTYTGEVFKVEGNFYVAPVEDPAKFYITGNASLVGADKAWHSDAIKVTEDTYIFENLPASYYQLKVSVDGTWSNTKGFSDLTGTVADGLSADGDNNICFKLDKAGDVTVTYTGEVFKVEGNFWVQRLHNGFYLVGTFNGVEKWDAASLTAGDEFEWNKNIGEGNDEWKITVALTAGDKFKAVYVYEDEITTWYPDGSDNEYLVNADHAGAEKTIFFQEKHNYEWGGHFYVESNGGSTAVDNAEATVTATKAIENGMLIIEKNNVRYTVTGQVIR